jgi:hypothetical protein
MSLDAAVYKNKRHLPFNAEALGASFDPETGEFFFEDEELDQKYGDVSTAISKPLGNVTAVGHLRQELSEALDSGSVVLSKIVYSGTHTGDCLPLDALADLESELSQIEEYFEGMLSPLVAQFVADMRELVSAARNEGNPIVF